MNNCEFLIDCNDIKFEHPSNWHLVRAGNHTWFTKLLKKINTFLNLKLINLYIVIQKGHRYMKTC